MKRLISALVLLMLAVGIISPISADGPTFESLGSLPSGWYSILWSNGEYNSDGQCYPGSCVTFNGSYARLELIAGYHLGVPYYENAEVAELETGSAYGTQTSHYPTVGSPVIASVEARFSAGFNSGSAGFWAWNSPIDGLNGYINPVEAIGISLIGGAAGHQVMITVYDAIAGTAYFVPAGVVDQTQWHAYSFTWSVNAAGTQHVDFYVDGNFVGGTDLARPMGSLSMEFWVDNQHYSGGNVTMLPVTSSRYMDIRNFSINK